LGVSFVENAIYWYSHLLALPPNGTPISLNKSISFLKYIMGDNKEIIRIDLYANSTELGRLLGTRGTIHMLNMISEKPMQYTDIANNVDIPKSTLVRRLNSLYDLKIVRKDDFIAKGRKTHLYSATKVGADMLKFFQSFERITSIHPMQQKLVEEEKQALFNE
jgi:DNA-binding HxlR family transcriptional regulator